MGVGVGVGVSVGIGVEVFVGAGVTVGELVADGVLVTTKGGGTTVAVEVGVGDTVVNLAVSRSCLALAAVVSCPHR